MLLFLLQDEVVQGANSVSDGGIWRRQKQHMQAWDGSGGVWKNCSEHHLPFPFSQHIQAWLGLELANKKIGGWGVQVCPIVPFGS